ncbi:MAG: hypothetical protein ABSA05_14420 [Opitutaceae bacterium]|jgi:hypothetical protein
MRIRLILLLVGLAALGVFCVVLKRERERNGSLQIEAARLGQVQVDRLRIQDENERLHKALASTGDLTALLKRHDDIERTRNAIDALSLQIRSMKRNLGQPADPVWPDGAEVVPSSEWRFAGQGSPADTLESVLFSARAGDVDRLAGLIALDPGTKAKADALFSRLPEEARTQYGTSEKVIATLIAAQMPTDYAAMATFREVDSDSNALLGVRIEDAAGGQRDLTFKFQRDEGNWRLDVPAPVASALAKQLDSVPASK